MSEKLLKLKQWFKEQGLTQEQIGERLNVSGMSVNVLLNGKRNFGVKSAMDWSREFGFNPMWLMTGEGEMLKGESPIPDNIVLIPHINMDSRGGNSPNVEIDCVEYAIEQLPFSRSVAQEGDVAISISGDSMSPRYPSGSIVLVRPIPTWREYIELGATYVIELQDGRRVIKVIKKGSDREHFQLCSVNPAYEPSEVARDFIARLYLVVLCLRKEVM